MEKRLSLEEEKFCYLLLSVVAFYGVLDGSCTYKSHRSCVWGHPAEAVPISGVYGAGGSCSLWSPDHSSILFLPATLILDSP